ncbi:MAG: ABC transporter permease [Nostocoides sp.]
MYAYIIRRLFSGALMLLVMSFITIFLFFSSPVDPGRVMCGKSCTPELIAQTKKALGYDKPVTTQWTDFVVGLVKGRDYPNDPELAKTHPELIEHCAAPCLGYSTITTQTVSTAIWRALPVSLSLALAAFVLWMVLGVGLGIIAALTKGTWIDRSIVGFSLMFYAFPTFALGLSIAIISIRIFGFTPQYVTIADGGVLGWAKGLILPAITLALVFIAGYVRLTRAFVIETRSEDYLRTAMAKGVAPRTVLFKHTMRAALTPIVTMAGVDLGVLLGGAIITETVFNYNGLGKLAVLSTQTYDLPIIVGIVLVAAAFVIMANLVVDVLYAFIDPRVKYS